MELAIFSGKGAFRAFLAGHFKLFRGQDLFPFFVGFVDLFLLDKASPAHIKKLDLTTRIFFIGFHIGCS